MDNRFTLKDFIFCCLFIVVIGVVALGMWQFSYQEQRLNDVKSQIQQLNDTQKQQLAILTKIAQGGLTISTASHPAVNDDVVRTNNPDGSYTVYAPRVPLSHHDPHLLPNFASGDWLVENLGDEPSTITPYLSRTLSEQAASNAILEGLLTRDRESLEWLPFLAERYTILPDKLTFRFVIRKEACFSDGVPVRADDVVFTYNTVMNANVEAEPSRSFMQRLKSVTKIDDRTVEMKFSEPYFDALNICAFGIMPEHIYKFSRPEEFNNNKTTVVGSGAYVLERWDRGQKMVLARNERYWAEKPAFDKIVYVFIMNPQAAMQSFLAGTIDESTPDPEQWEQYTAEAGFTDKYHCYKFISPDLSYRYIGWNEARPQFKDKLTRQALTMLIDRQAIINTIQRGMAVLTTGPFNPASPQYDSTIQPWPYDPDAARKKLSEAGWKAGPDGVLVRDGVRFEFELSIPNNSPQYDKASAYIKEQYEKAGIRMKIVPYEFAVLSQNLDDRKFDAAMLGWGGSAGEDDPTQIWSSKSIAGKGSNYISFNNPQTDALLDQAVHELDKDKRMALWHQFHQIIHEEQPYTFLSSAVTRAFIAGRIDNTKPDALGLNDSDWFVPAAEQKYH